MMGMKNKGVLYSLSFLLTFSLMGLVYGSEKSLSQPGKKPEDKITFKDQKEVELLIKNYFEALEKGDDLRARALTSSKENKLHPKSKTIKQYMGIKSVKLVGMKRCIIDEETGYSDNVPENIPTVCFKVKLEIKPEPDTPWDKGVNWLFVNVVKEDDRQWRINGLGTGP
jgi:hypothetical protein